MFDCVLSEISFWYLSHANHASYHNWNWYMYWHLLLVILYMQYAHVTLIDNLLSYLTYGVTHMCTNSKSRNWPWALLSADNVKNQTFNVLKYVSMSVVITLDNDLCFSYGDCWLYSFCYVSLISPPQTHCPGIRTLGRKVRV